MGSNCRLCPFLPLLTLFTVSLGPILQSPNPNQNLQLLYQTLNCFWLLSYNDIAARYRIFRAVVLVPSLTGFGAVFRRMSESSVLQSMLSLIKTVMKEKVCLLLCSHLLLLSWAGLFASPPMSLTKRSRSSVWFWPPGVTS